MHDLESYPIILDGRLENEGRSIVISAPAKINLFLKVTGKRSDGYHDLFSWFQALDLCDTLRVTRRDDSDITITTNNPDIPTGETNLVFRAARILRERAGVTSGFEFELFKRIPVGAGMGGGSSDAAAALKAINILLGKNLSLDKMVNFGLDIGSDIPFFFSRGQAEITGRGEIVKEIDLPLDYCVRLITPQFEISAAEAYQKLSLDLTDQVQVITLPRCRDFDDLVRAINGLENDLEKELLVSYPVLGKIKDYLLTTGADVVRLTGSGPTVFALYRHRNRIMESKRAQLFEGEKWGYLNASPIRLPAKR